MARNVTLLVLAVFLSFAAGSYAQDAIATATEAHVAAEAAATPTAATPVTAPVEVTLAATPTDVTATLASDVTTTTGEGAAWTNITNGLWMILAGVLALVAIWWKKRKLAATPKP